MTNNNEVILAAILLATFIRHLMQQSMFYFRKAQERYWLARILDHQFIQRSNVSLAGKRGG
jgi:hypothetical protein